MNANKHTMKAAIKCFGTLLFFIGSLHAAHAQQGFGTANPAPNSVIELTSPNNDKGLLLPRVALQATDVTAPLDGTVEAGMLVYNTATNGSGNTAVVPGLYCFSGTEWIRVKASNGLSIDQATGDVILGGDLTKPTEIITDEDNTLAISGLEPGNPDNDRIVTVDEDGVLKTVSSNKFVRFFYMPSVIFDTSSEDDDLERDLYQEYIDQFTGIDVNLRSTGAPPSIPHIPDRNELYYYITYYDDEVFNIQGINENGILTYDIIGSGTPMSFMNIVFVIKGEETEDKD